MSISPFLTTPRRQKQPSSPSANEPDNTRFIRFTQRPANSIENDYICHSFKKQIHMKRLLSLTVLLAALLTGCQPTEKKLEQKKSIVMTKSNEWNISATSTGFRSSDPAIDKSCQLLNNQVQTYISRLSDTLKAQAADLFQSFEADTADRPSWKYELIIKDSVFMATDRYISVRLLAYTFTGGAHGMTTFKAFNYDVKNQKLLTPQEIIDTTATTAVNAALKTHFKNPDNCFSSDPTLQQVSAVNFNAQDLCFTYEQYLLGAYACGVAEVSVPRPALKEALLIK